MAISTRIELPQDAAFPHGLYAFKDTEVQPERDFDKSTRETFVQAKDRDTGLPVWTLEVLDADPEARKNAAITVRILAERQPVLPEVPAGWPVRPIEFEGLRVTPYVDSSRCKPRRGEEHRCSGRLAWSFRATGIKAGSSAQAGRPAAKKEAA